MKQLRYYQANAKKAVYTAIAQGKTGIMVVHCTGSGKTVLISDIAKDYVDQGKRVLCLTRYDHLIEQIESQMKDAGLNPFIEQAGKFAPKKSEVVLASVMTMKGKRLERWSPEDFDVILADECHHSRAGVYEKILLYFTGTVVGFTATPHNNGEAEDFHVLNEIVHSYPLAQAIRDGFAADVVVKKGALAIPLSECRIKRGDFHQGDLSKVMMQCVVPLVSVIAHEVSGPTLVFSVDIANSKAIAEGLNAMGIRAAAYHSDLAKGEKKALREKFKNGEIQVLVNPVSLTEGYDLPSVETVIIARPTLSKRLMAQMIGRGTRPKSAKEPGTCKVVEFDHGMVKDIVQAEMVLFDDFPYRKLAEKLKKITGNRSLKELLSMNDEFLKKGWEKYLLGVVENMEQFQVRFETAYSVLEARVAWQNSMAYNHPASDKLKHAIAQEEIEVPDNLTKGKGCDIIHALRDLPGKRELFDSHKGKMKEMWQYLQIMAAY